MSGETVDAGDAAPGQQRRAVGAAVWRAGSKAWTRASCRRPSLAKGNYAILIGQKPVPASDLSGARAGRAGRASDPGHGRRGALRPRCRMARRPTIPPPSTMPCRRICRNALRPASPPIGRELRAEMLAPGYSGVRPKTGGPKRPQRGFPHRRTGNAWPARPGQSVRHRKSRPHRIAGDCGQDRRNAARCLRNWDWARCSSARPMASPTRAARCRPQEAAAILARAAEGGHPPAGYRRQLWRGGSGAGEAAIPRPFRIVTKTIGLQHGAGRGGRAGAAIGGGAESRYSAGACGVRSAGRGWRCVVGGPARPARRRRVPENRHFRLCRRRSGARWRTRFRPDVMQLPFSLLDQRLLADGTLARLEGSGRRNPCPLAVPARPAVPG